MTLLGEAGVVAARRLERVLDEARPARGKYCVADERRINVERMLENMGWQINGEYRFLRNERIGLICDRGHALQRGCYTLVKGRPICGTCRAEDTTATVKRIIEEKGGTHLGERARKKNIRCVRVRCARNHEWTAKNYLILRGSWCLKCSREERRTTLDQAKRIAEANGGRCLARSLRDSRHSVKWECEEGHRFTRSVLTIQVTKKFCPKCNKARTAAIPGSVKGRKRPSAKMAFEDAKRVAKERGGECLSTEYRNNHEKLVWRCVDGHEWEATQQNVVHRKSWCPICARAKSWKKRVRAIAERNGATILSDRLERVSQPIKWQCKNGHVFEKVIKDPRHRAFCRECKALESREHRG